VLQKIATETDGKYFRATNTAKLKEIYDSIDKLEKTKIDVTEFRNHTEEFYPWALVALILLCADIILRFTLFKNIP
jgi:Ca-activated chloride channel family protein